jgi:hypothetical protein
LNRFHQGWVAANSRPRTRRLPAILRSAFEDIKRKAGRNRRCPTSVLCTMGMAFHECFATICSSMERGNRSRLHGAMQARQNSVSLSPPERPKGIALSVRRAVLAARRRSAYRVPRFNAQLNTPLFETGPVVLHRRTAQYPVFYLVSMSTRRVAAR